MRRLNLLLFFVAITAGLSAQPDTASRFLYAKSPLYGSYGFAHTVQGRVLPISGLQTAVGVNIAGLFHTKWILGACVEWRVFKALGMNRRYDKIRGDVIENLIHSQPGLTDSTRVDFLFDAFNGMPGGNSFYGGRFFGSNHYRYGIIISPFPDDYGGLMLTIKRGANGLPVHGAYGITALKYEAEDYIFLSVPVDLGLELSCKPFLFLHERTADKWYDAISQNLLLSVYWDHLSMDHATFNGAPLRNFVGDPFFEKNGSDNHFGVKLSFGYY